jgi:Tfp pilus assembly protein PilW
MKQDTDLTGKFLKNEKGLGLIELMMAAIIMIIVLAGSIKVFTYQQSLIQDENDTAKIRAKGRHAVKFIAKEVRMAGFGLPPHQAITNSNPLPATVDTLNFRTNVGGVRTMMDSTTDASVGNTSITIIPGVAFSDGDSVVIYNPNESDDDIFDLVTVVGDVSDSATTMFFFPDLENKYKLFTNANSVPINKYNNYSIFQDGNQIKKTIDDVTIPIINDLDLSSNGLVFDFNGATDTADVVRIGITLNMLDPNNPDATMEFHTDVTLRNSRS